MTTRDPAARHERGARVGWIVALALLVWGAGCSDEAIKISDLDRLLAESRGLRSRFEAEQLGLRATYEEVQVNLGALEGLDRTLKPELLGLLRTAMMQCFNEPAQDALLDPERAARIADLSLLERVETTCQADALGLLVVRLQPEPAPVREAALDKVDRVIMLRDALKGLLPSMVERLGTRFLKAQEVFVRIGSKSELLANRALELDQNDDQIRAKYTDAMGGEREAMDTTLKGVEELMNATLRRVDLTLEKTLYALAVFGLGVPTTAPVDPTDDDASNVAPEAR